MRFLKTLVAFVVATLVGVLGNKVLGLKGLLTPEHPYHRTARNQDVLPAQHPQIAMDAFRRVEKERRRAGAGHGRSNLLPDQSRFPHAGNHHFTFAREEKIDRFREAAVQTIDKGLDCAGLDCQHTLAFIETATATSSGRLGRDVGLQFRGLAASHIRITRSRSDFN